MPKNITGGNRHKKAKNKPKQEEVQQNKRVELAGENQIYALVKSRSGGTRLQVECSDGQKRSAIIPGKFYKKVWMNAGDIILCELKDADINSCYVIYKYTPKEANVLKSQGHINFEVMQEVDEKQGFKFTENTVSPQQRNLDLNDIDDSMSLESEDNEPEEKQSKDKSHHSSEEAESEDSIDIDDL
ncbi:translation initiation factor 1A / IF-1 [Klosneuvirus KNV1]|uniref:Translation initiation factor 1A / IF-1 n=1 Tax=Klosneuvirus KNV1 TaxID=1977640 RepID=A0A1V0SIS3_9VIRU|nr:translation initiation factor 1A / IF-1 [Klosneuvirus KNV1]